MQVALGRRIVVQAGGKNGGAGRKANARGARSTSHFDATVPPMGVVGMEALRARVYIDSETRLSSGGARRRGTPHDASFCHTTVIN